MVAVVRVIKFDVKLSSLRGILGSWRGWRCYQSLQQLGIGGFGVR
jgi:hypothetical protein